MGIMSQIAADDAVALAARERTMYGDEDWQDADNPALEAEIFVDITERACGGDLALLRDMDDWQELSGRLLAFVADLSARKTGITDEGRWRELRAFLRREAMAYVDQQIRASGPERVADELGVRR